MEGAYCGKNLYVQNPMADDGFGYCASKVYLNGILILDSIALQKDHGAFEIDLLKEHLELDQKIIIEIVHENGCLPKVLLNDFLPTRRNVIYQSIVIDTAKNILWTVTNPTSYSYFIEQYRWNKWIQVGEISNKDSISKNSYSHHLDFLHAGINKFRICQMNEYGDKSSSQEISFVVNKPSVKFEQNKETKSINFTEETRFEIYNNNGSIVKKGVSKNIDCSNLIDGIYFMNYDSLNVKIVWGEKRKRKKNSIE